MARPSPGLVIWRCSCGFTAEARATERALDRLASRLAAHITLSPKHDDADALALMEALDAAIDNLPALLGPAMAVARG